MPVDIEICQLVCVRGSYFIAQNLLYLFCLTSLVMRDFHLVCAGSLFCCVGNRQFVCVRGSAVGGYALKMVRLTVKWGWYVCIIAYNGNEHSRRSGRG